LPWWAGVQVSRRSVSPTSHTLSYRREKSARSLPFADPCCDDVVINGVSISASLRLSSQRRLAIPDPLLRRVTNAHTEWQRFLHSPHLLQLPTEARASHGGRVRASVRGARGAESRGRWSGSFAMRRARIVAGFVKAMSPSKDGRVLY
jgi:hypothetical protein